MSENVEHNAESAAGQKCPDDCTRDHAPCDVNRWLTEADRLALSGVVHQNYYMPAVWGVVEAIVANHRAEAWSECFDAFIKRSRPTESKALPTNPYTSPTSPADSEARVCTCGTWDDPELAHAPDCQTYVTSPGAFDDDADALFIDKAREATRPTPPEGGSND